MARKYELQKRAEAMEETRRRITEAAVELHGSVGPARASITAVAERAGVQRHTVYRHFPTEDDLFAACSAHYTALNPVPDIARWSTIDDPEERLERGLSELYGFYERTGHMWTNVYRDADLVEGLRPPLEQFREWLDGAARTLAAGWGTRRKLLTAATRHAVAFETWRSLTDGGATRPQAVALMRALVVASAARPTSSRAAAAR